MEESVQKDSQEKQLEEQKETFQEEEVEYKSQNEQGDFRRRLRDRDLLKKRKAEAEEKETDEWDFGTESPQKRARSGAKRGRRRGRPRKTEPSVNPDSQYESVLVQDAPAVVTEAVPVYEELTPAPPPLVIALGRAVDIAPAVVQDVSPAADSASLPVPPVLRGPMFTELQTKPALDQVLIEDLGPDEAEDLPSKEEQADEGYSEKPEISTAETTFLSDPTSSSAPPPQQEYVPGNSY
ncbi:hypothetical protein NL108_005898 [Boleophthalmus pectinirostris]|uniref:hemogen n=1 Tax=Boleophthalmus pectinirostris TaxID=150288 RepID=UPI000A1C2E80|nr:hemogen [Boleophthalmus pectinirostris]KAJ0050764.1 hypothetical protein NL108_005898 [Boleophthalmus pectinirostris]